MEKVIAIDIGASKVRIRTVDRNGDLGPENLTSLIGLEPDNTKFIQLLAGNIKLVMDAEKDSAMAAISIGSPGPLDPFRGVIEDTPNLRGVKDLRIIDELKDIFDLPTYLLNDADAGALGEWWLGAGKSSSRAFYITISTGVGSGYVINGKLERGAFGKAPESGHTDLFVENDQRLCACGRWSHAEAYLGTDGLAETYAKVFGLKPADLSPEDRHSVSPKMRERIAGNDKKWLKVQETYAGHLAFFLRNIIYNFQPEIIVIGGGIAFGNKPLLKSAEKKLDELMDPKKDKISTMAKGVRIALAVSANNVNLGAAKYAFDLINTVRKGEKTYGDMA